MWLSTPMELELPLPEGLGTELVVEIGNDTYCDGPLPENGLLLDDLRIE